MIETNSGDICVCSHRADDHHRSWFPKGYELIEECEYYGSNETGGAMVDELTGRWIDHCMKFKLDVEVNHDQTGPSRETKGRN